MAYTGSWFGGSFGQWFGATVPAIEPAGFVVIAVPDEPVNHTMSWQTDVIKSWGGLEHRAAVIGYPRESYQLQFTLDDAELRFLRAELYRRATQVFLIPARQEALVLAAALSGSAFDVNNTYADWLIPGRRVILENTSGGYDAGVIQSVGVGPGVVTATLDPTPVNAYAAGTSFLYPLVPAFLDDSAPTARYRVNVGTWTAQARQMQFATSLGVGAALTTYAGLPVIDRRPLANDLNQESNEARLEFADYGAVIESMRTQVPADIRRTHRYYIPSAAERQYWKLFFQTVMGMQKPFYLSTWKPDLLVHTQPTSTSLRVYGLPTAPSYLADWFASVGERKLSIELVNGTILYRAISSAVDNLDGTQTLVMTVAIDTGAVGNIATISLLEKCRLASDSAVFEHSSTASRVTLSALTTRDP